MKRILHVFLFLSITAFSLNACSSADEEEDETAPQQGGTVKNYEMVIINIPNSDLTQNEYEGALGGEPVTLIKTEDNQLTFGVSGSIPAGEHDLVIPALNNRKVHYTVMEATLSGTPDQVLTYYFTTAAEYVNNLGNSEDDAVVKASYEEFMTAYEGMSIDEKKEIALIYTNNTTVFGDIMFGGMSSGRFGSQSDVEVVNEMIVGLNNVGFFKIFSGNYLQFLSISNKFFEFNLNAGYNNLLNAYSRVARLNLIVDTFVLKNIKDNESGNISGPFISFTSDKEETMSFKVEARKLKDSDRDRTVELTRIFGKIDRYNQQISSLNIKVPGAHLYEISFGGDIYLETINMTPSMMPGFTFSATISGGELVTAVIEEEGVLKVKFKRSGNLTQPTVPGTLNLEYKDVFNTHSGAFSVQVKNANPLIGTWNMQSFNNGFLPGQYVSTYGFELCPNIVTGGYTTQYLTLTFTESNFNQTGSDIIVNGNVSKDENCNVIQDLPDTSTTDNYSEDGTYTLNGNTITINSPGDPEPGVETITFITPDKIKIGGDVFVRQ
ncbi:MAG: hypothetical protein DI539_26125 [Flavobacterium psychrophilum]|nr:MAG: hypothetical protein DI539_26125 [Flavobacterium psychrophilum]